MLAPLLLLAAASLSVVCKAQVNLTTLPPLTSNNTVLNITFSDPRSANCGRSSASQNESVTITVRTLNLDVVCMNLDYIFTHPNVTFAPGEHYPDQQIQGNRYFLSTSAASSIVGWSPSVFNYSQIFYTQRRANLDKGEDDTKLGNVMVRAFQEEDCPGNGLNFSATPPWYSWNCADETGHCSTLSFAVKSILLSGLNDDKVPGESGCVTAVQYDVGTMTRASLSAVLLFVFGTAIILAM